MKKFCIVLICLAVSAFLFAEQRTLISSKNVEFGDLNLYDPHKSKSTLSQKEFEEDLDNLCYIIEAGYSGYEDMCSRGFDIPAFKISVSEELNTETVLTSDFYNSACRFLQPYIQDGHFTLGISYKSKNFYEKNIVFWSDIFVEKKGEKWIVIKSNVPEIATGTVYSGSEENLYYYPAAGKKAYRLGKMTVYANSLILNDSLEFDGKAYSVELKADTAIPSENMKYREIETGRTGYVVLNNFNIPFANDPRRKSAELIFKKFADAGTKFSKKKNVILDLRGNQGGNSPYAACFFYSLYTGKTVESMYDLYVRCNQWDYSIEEFLDVYSPVTTKIHYEFHKSLGMEDSLFEYEKLRSNPVRLLFKVTPDKDNLFDQKSEFKGNLIILTDRHNFSAGEKAIQQAKMIFGDAVKIMGENSAGMLTYYDVISIGLPNSGILVHTPMKKMETIQTLDYWKGEGFGMMPDIWSEGDDLNETIYLLTKDSEMKSKLTDIGNRLM